MAVLPNHPGVSKYPVKEGVVFRLLKPKIRLNKEIGATIPHHVYIWIQRFNTGKYEGPPKARPIRALFLYIPMISCYKDKFIIWENKVQFKRITKDLNELGYKVIATNCKYYYNKWSYKNFYTKIGLLDA